VARLTLLCPGLLGPAVPLDELPQGDWPGKPQLPNLSLLLNRCQVERINRHSLEHQILNLTGHIIQPGDELPVAQLRRAGRGTEDVPLWCLDPVHIRIDREMAYLAAPGELELTEAEAQSLISSLNQHFADDMQVHYHSPLQWLAQIDLLLSTLTPGESTMQDISRSMPTGDDATRWRSLVNEIQMLLYNHPVNQSRQQEGKLTVNSVWLWGGGKLQWSPPELDVVYTDDRFAGMAASLAQIHNAALPSQLDDALLANQNSLLVITDLQSAILQKDVYAWLDGLKQLEHRILSPILAMLNSGRLDQVVLQTDGVRMSLMKRDLRKWWRRSASIQTRVLALRKKYGD